MIAFCCPAALAARLARYAAVALVSLGVGIVGIGIIDWRVQRSALESIHPPSSGTSVTVFYRNLFLDDARANRWRRRSFGGVLPFDRQSGFTVIGKIDDAYASRLVAFAELTGSPTRIRLSIEDGGISDAILEKIGRFEELADLSIQVSPDASSAECSEKGCESLMHLPRLRTLGLYGLPVGDSGVSALVRAGGRDLSQIWLYGSHVSDAGLKQLALLPALDRLELRDSQASREGGWEFRLSRPEVIFGGPNVPNRVTHAEFQAYRHLHDRLRRAKGDARPMTSPSAAGR